MLVAANGELHHARWVVKTHATGLATFASPGRGPVGEVSERGVRFVAPSPPPPPRSATGEVRSRIPIVASHWDVDPGTIDWHLERGVDGIVLEGGGAGNVNGALADGIERAIATGIPVVGTTRCVQGEVTPVYGGSGGFASLTAARGAALLGPDGGQGPPGTGGGAGVGPRSGRRPALVPGPGGPGVTGRA